MGVFKPRAVHPVAPALMQALSCLLYFPADGGKIQATRSAGGRRREHYNEKRKKIRRPADFKNMSVGLGVSLIYFLQLPAITLLTVCQ